MVLQQRSSDGVQLVLEPHHEPHVVLVSPPSTLPHVVLVLEPRVVLLPWTQILQIKSWPRSATLSVLTTTLL